MNLLTGFFGVPWFFFSMKQFGLRFAFFVSLGFVFSPKKTWLVIWFGGASGGGSYQ